MIYSITFNPSLDLKISLDKFMVNNLNRYNNEIISPGGKGINVSLMLKTLNIPSTALGFYGGFTGEELINILDKKIKTKFIKVKGDTRINIKIESKQETEINGSGPLISQEKFAKLETIISKLKTGDILVVSGSIPNGQKEAYKKIGKLANKNKVLLIADTNNSSLKDILKFKPFLIKPNQKEAEELFKTKIKNESDIIDVLIKFRKSGAQNILLSLGSKGAYIYTKDKRIFKIKAPKGKVINTIGSGDSMLAGFIAGLIKTNNPSESLKLAVAAGSASAFSKNLANKKDVQLIMKKLKVEEVK